MRNDDLIPDGARFAFRVDGVDESKMSARLKLLRRERDGFERQSVGLTGRKIRCDFVCGCDLIDTAP